ncbi:nuclear mRNA export, poly(A)+RNA binding protein, partial [Modicella reniformis]
MQLVPPLRKNKGELPDNWTVYTIQSRNMTRVKDLDPRTKRLHYGNKDIVREGLMKIPATKHDLSDASKFCIDAWQTGGLLPAVCIYISMHGAFEELHHGRKGLLKSFDRTFIIAPAPPSS